MKALDEVLDAAAADIRRATEQLPIPTTFPDDGVRLVRRRESHMRVLVGAAAVALLVVGIVWIQARPTDSPSVIPSDVTSTSLAGPGVASLPLELTQTPPGYAMVGQVVRPRAEVNLRSAVFVKRDPQGEVIDKVVVRVGDFSLVGFEQGEIVSAPANLPTAGTGRRVIEESSRVVHVEFLVRDFGHLDLASYHQDATTDLQVADQMLAMAATLDLSTADISVVGSLPDGWELAVSGHEPGYVAEEFFQAFEVDVPEGGNKILISNWMTTDVGMPYWEMDETLDPINVRGHSGFVSTIAYPPSDPTAPPPPNAGGSTSLIWMEAPGHWVTLRAHDMDVGQVLALADQLTPAVSGQWGETTGVAVTTTTAQPGIVVATTAAFGEDDATYTDLTQLLLLTTEQSFLLRSALAAEAGQCMRERGFEYDPEVVRVDVTPIPTVPTSEEVAQYGYLWRARRAEQRVNGTQEPTLTGEAQEALDLCTAAANEALAMDELNGPKEVIGSAVNQITANALSAPSYLSALARWAECLGAFGYKVDDSAPNGSLAESLPGGASGSQAIEMAVRDYACQDQVGLNSTFANLTFNATREWLAANLGVVEQYRRLQVELLARAEPALN